MNVQDLQLLRLVKYQVIVGLIALVGLLSISTVFAQTNTPAPTDTMTATPTVVIPQEAPSTGHAE